MGYIHKCVGNKHSMLLDTIPNAFNLFIYYHAIGVFATGPEVPFGGLEMLISGLDFGTEWRQVLKCIFLAFTGKVSLCVQSKDPFLALNLLRKLGREVASVECAQAFICKPLISRSSQTSFVIEGTLEYACLESLEPVTIFVDDGSMTKQAMEQIDRGIFISSFSLPYQLQFDLIITMPEVPCDALFPGFGSMFRDSTGRRGTVKKSHFQA